MKYRILLCAICVSVLFSCKKEKKASDTKLYPINFKISGFTQTDVPIGLGKTKTAALVTQAADTIPVQKLTYLLFATDTHSSLLSQISFVKGSADFGTFTDKVAPGNYVAVFCGGSADIKTYTSMYPMPHYELGYSLYWDDTFYKRIPITVTATGINMRVGLDRITARLDLVIKDAIPVGTSQITISFTDTLGYDATNGGGKLNFIGTTLVSKTITTADIGKTNYTITTNTLNNIIPFDVTISYYGPNHNAPLNIKTIKNVVCKTNTKTTLSGNLFDPGNNGFSITVNQDWDIPVTIGF
jgi:hypothetical protein